MITRFLEFLKENNALDIVEFLKDKAKVNKRSKFFLYHGTQVKPQDFTLRDDWDGNNGNIYETDLPEGYLFLTTDLREAKAYGQYIIPCELRYYSKITVKVDSENPSREFDDDYSGYGDYGMWTKFMNSGKAVLEVKGYSKSTFVTAIENVIPRTDLAQEFYNIK